jgi:hypothetical protein
MLQLLYISTARDPITAAMCDDILAVSRRNNRECDITGLLVAGRRRFLQALEGPEEQVRATYDRIAADPRHYACVVLSRRHVEQRGFGDWAMGHVAGGDDCLFGSDLRATVAALVAPIEDSNLRAQFTGFIEVQSTAA